MGTWTGPGTARPLNTEQGRGFGRLFLAAGGRGKASTHCHAWPGPEPSTQHMTSTQARRRRLEGPARPLCARGSACAARPAGQPGIRARGEDASKAASRLAGGDAPPARAVAGHEIPRAGPPAPAIHAGS